MCTNSDGLHIFYCMGIREANQTNYFYLSEKSYNTYKLYKSQTNSWMNGSLCDDYFHTIWNPSVRSRTSYNEFMIFDECSAHGNYLTKLTVAYYLLLPPNFTSIYKPMFQGIIQPLSSMHVAKTLRQFTRTMGWLTANN